MRKLWANIKIVLLRAVKAIIDRLKNAVDNKLDSLISSEKTNLEK